jgi:hypothetical protein
LLQLVVRLLSRSRALTWFLFFRALAPLSPDVCFLLCTRAPCHTPPQFVFLSRSRAPLCPAFGFFRALAPRRRSCFSRALAPRRRSISRAPSARRALSLALSCPAAVRFLPPPPTVCFFSLSRPDAVRFLAPPLPGVRFLSRSRAPSARRLFSFALSCPDVVRVSLALSRPDAIRFLAPSLPEVRFLLLSLSRAPDAVRSCVFSRPLPTNPATFAFSRTLAPLRPPFAFSPARLCSCCSKTGRLRAHILLVLMRVLVLVRVRVRVLCEYVTIALASARVL